MDFDDAGGNAENVDDESPLLTHSETKQRQKRVQRFRSYSSDGTIKWSLPRGVPRNLFFILTAWWTAGLLCFIWFTAM